MSLLLLAVGLTAGLIARQLGLNHPRAPELINGAIINAALPAMILLNVPSLTWSTSALAPVVLAWSVTGVTAALVYWMARRCEWSTPVTGALLMVVPLSNTAYLGLPLIGALAPDETVGYAILYDQLGNFMGLAIYASLVTAVLGKHNVPPTLTGVARRILLFPPFLVTLVALTLSADALPPWSLPPLGVLGAAMGPLAMLIVGLQLEPSLPGRLRQPLYFGATIKLLFAPVFVWFVAGALKVDDAAAQASVLQAAMPCMITAGILGIAAGFSRVLTIALIGLTTLASAITLPLAFWAMLG